MIQKIKDFFFRIKLFLKRYPIAYHTVDICIWRKHENDMQILLVQKKDETNTDKWRFVGGFVDVIDNSVEDAALREVKEETQLEVSEIKYIGSFKIDDKRYRNSRHKIITSFYAARYLYGQVGKGYDDIALTKWFNLNELNNDIINEIHIPLLDMVKKHDFGR